MNRRHFLQTAGSSLGWAATPLLAGEPALIAGIGACDWTLGLAGKPEALDRAKRIGLDGVQVELGTQPAPGGSLPLRDRALQEAYAAKAAATGVKIPSLALGILNRIAYKSSPDAERWVLESVEVAQRMKTPVVLLAFFGAGDLRNDPAGIDAVISRLKRLAPRAQEAGVVYGIESWLKVPDLERILDAVNSPSLRVYYDVGNMTKEGEDIHAAVRQLGSERICEMHMKDYEDLYGMGSVDFSRVRQSIEAAGYHGWVHIEGVKVPNGIEQDIKYDLDYLRKIFA